MNSTDYQILTRIPLPPPVGGTLSPGEGIGVREQREGNAYVF